MNKKKIIALLMLNIISLSYAADDKGKEEATPEDKFCWVTLHKNGFGGDKEINIKADIICPITLECISDTIEQNNKTEAPTVLTVCTRQDESILIGGIELGRWATGSVNNVPNACPLTREPILGVEFYLMSPDGPHAIYIGNAGDYISLGSLRSCSGTGIECRSRECFRCGSHILAFIYQNATNFHKKEMKGDCAVSLSRRFWQTHNDVIGNNSLSLLEKKKLSEQYFKESIHWANVACKNGNATAIIGFSTIFIAREAQKALNLINTALDLVPQESTVRGELYQQLSVIYKSKRMFNQEIQALYDGMNCGNHLCFKVLFNLYLDNNMLEQAAQLSDNENVKRLLLDDGFKAFIKENEALITILKTKVLRENIFKKRKRKNEKDEIEQDTKVPEVKQSSSSSSSVLPSLKRSPMGDDIEKRYNVSTFVPKKK